MVVAVSAAAADPVAHWLEERLSGSRVVGEVVDQGRVVTHSDPGVRFVRY